MNSKDSDAKRAVISDTINHIDILQKQSINLLDKPETHHRMVQLLDALDEQIHAFNHQFPDPSPEVNRYLQDLFFHVKEMKGLVEKLASDPHGVEPQQKFASALDDLKRDLNRLV